MPVFRGDLLEAEVADRGRTWGEVAAELHLAVDTVRAARRGEPVSAATMRRILAWLDATPVLVDRGLLVRSGSK